MGADVVRGCGVGVSGWVGVVEKKLDLKKPFKERGDAKQGIVFNPSCFMLI